jgi:chromosome segregation ATPase
MSSIYNYNPPLGYWSDENTAKRIAEDNARTQRALGIIENLNSDNTHFKQVVESNTSEIRRLMAELKAAKRRILELEAQVAKEASGPKDTQALPIDKPETEEDLCF